MCEGEKFNCSTCTPRDKIVRGCTSNRKWKVGKYEVFGCPQKLITQEVGLAMELWGKWKRFGFPHAGGWAEQIARVFDVIEALEAEMGEVESRRAEKARGNS